MPETLIVTKWEKPGSPPKGLSVPPGPVERKLESISSTFYKSVFCTKFWRQKLQSCFLGLKFFGAKISAQNACVKLWWNWHLICTELYCQNSEEAVLWASPEVITLTELTNGMWKCDNIKHLISLTSCYFKLL